MSLGVVVSLPNTIAGEKVPAGCPYVSLRRVTLEPEDIAIPPPELATSEPEFISSSGSPNDAVTICPLIKSPRTVRLPVMSAFPPTVRSFSTVKLCCAVTIEEVS